MARLLLIDGHNLAFRSFYGIGELSRSDGFPTNAIHGWIKTFWNLQDLIRPDHVVALFDRGRSQRRREILPTYKAQRKRMPDGLAQQLPFLREVSLLLGATRVEQESVEADDLLASLAVREESRGHEIAIASSDKDFCQIVSDHILLWTPPPAKSLSRHWIPMDPSAVEKKFGVRPEQIVDFLCLTGDNVDNIDGLAGVGPKTAARWIRDHGTLERILERAHADGFPQRLGEKLRADEGKLFRNRCLIRFDLSLDPYLPRELSPLAPNWDFLEEFCQRFQLESLGRSLSLRRRQSPARENHRPASQMTFF
jgi:DNA polymerase-1